MVDISKIQQLISEDPRSLYQIAKDADLDYALIHRLIKGKVKKNIWLGTAFKLADVLGVDVNEFRKELDEC